MLFSKPLILLFNDNPALMNVTVTSMHIYFQGFFMMSFQFAGQSTFTALGRSKQAVFFSLFRKVVIVVWDAVKKDEESVEKADVLICDLPCSGLGIIGRKPDIKYNVTYEKIKELALLQRKILSTAWEYVKKDGILIYSTCTVTPEENAENTEWLVNNYPFELIGKPEQIMPQDGTGDGFYIARLKRTE